ncbi:hypothetical protein MPL3356_340178 [Mesorhizobium plurifarium]|uniref:Uncharacterized protein n=1 Tax=Mesorhizobium plurifarium TaxID=69974 RepID=A0A090DVN4_MESPL|nr:hypothetical protein MPL3356_340178 [Mesorhizobium plurifarium]
MENEIRRRPEVSDGNAYNFISHYVNAMIRALYEFFDQHPRRRSPYVLSA